MEGATATPPDQTITASKSSPLNSPPSMQPESLERRRRDSNVSDDNEVETEESRNAAAVEDNSGVPPPKMKTKKTVSTKLDVPTLTMTHPTPVKAAPGNFGVSEESHAEAATDTSAVPLEPSATEKSSTTTGSRGAQRGTRSREQVEKDLSYLAKHNVCQTLELMVKQLLRDRPDDPTLAICNMLRGGTGARVNPLRNSGKSLQLPPPPTPTSELDEKETPAASPTQDGAKHNFPLPKTRAAGTTTTTNTATGQRHDHQGTTLSRGGSANHLHQTSGSGGSPTLQGAAAAPAGNTTHVRPTSSGSAGSAILRAKAGGRSTSATPSQNAGAGGNPSRRGSASHGALNSNVSEKGTAASGHRTLERDESTKSEFSTFSVNSVDMTEFIQEFRAAHHAVFPKGQGEVISRNDLAEVVDRVALPLPDIRMLADLFSEIDVGECDLIKFDVFLARMCFKIQGRYQQEVLKGIFYSMVPGGHATFSRQTAAAAANNNNGSHHQSGAGSGAPVGVINRSGMPPPSISMNSLPDEAANYYHGHGKAGGQLGAVGHSAQQPPNHEDLASVECEEKVPKIQCFEEGIRDGLGLRGVSAQDFNDACKRVGIQADDETPVQLSEFLRVVHSLTGAGGGPSSATSPSAGSTSGGGYASGHGNLGSSVNQEDPVVA